MTRFLAGGWRVFLMVLGISSLTAGAVSAQAVFSPSLRWDADARLGYFNIQSTTRSGEDVSSDDFRARVRFGPTFYLTPIITARVRAAGRFSSDQSSTSFYIRDRAPTVDGIGFGDVTLDEAYIDLHPSDRWSVRVGRMQTRSTLADLQGKSLIRMDSPNMEVTWTDGVRLAAALPGGWNSQLILQHNAAEGPTNTLRPPLEFTDSDSRLSIFAGVENTAPWGPVVQRGVDLLYIPASLPVAMGAAREFDDYLGVVARGLLRWPLLPTDGAISLGGSVGYAPRTPSRAQMALGGLPETDAGGVAYQLAVSVADVIPRHRFGVVYGQAEAGWLVAPDFRNNDRLLEARYQWAMSSQYTFEARVRHRQELEQLRTATRKRHDNDFYVRFNARF